MNAVRMSVLAMVAGVGPASVVHAQPVLRDLGTLGGTVSYGNAISADGRVVVGSSGTYRDIHTHAFRWTASGGMEDLGTLMTDQNSYGSSVSGDGLVVSGFAPAEGSNVHAVRWSAATGGIMLDCGTLGGKDSLALAMNFDGSMIAGFAALPSTSRGHACLWSYDASGVERVRDLGALGGQESKCYGMSADGSVLAGVTDMPGSSSTRAFRWTLADGMRELGTLGGANSRGFAISGSGGAIVGYSEVTVNGGASSSGRAFRWTAAQGMQNLGSLGGASSAAYAVSADGLVVAGYDTVPFTGSSHAFVWQPSTGMVDLNVLLPSLGVNMSGWTLIGVNAISADGTAVVGNARHNGLTRAFLITDLPRTWCRADFDRSGTVATQDIFAFLNAWFAGEPAADVDGAAGLSQQDIHAFLNVWFGGC